MDKFVAVIDYGLGNLRSVAKALEAVGANVKITSQPEDLKAASAIVLPGVGAFKRAMDNLIRLSILPSISSAIKSGKPFLGICLGLQILFTESREHGLHKGLDVIKGEVKKFSPGVKIPHMGWNQVRSGKTGLFKNIPDGAYFYFVHSYYVQPEDKNVIIGSTKYGVEFASAINKGNLWGVQFHPEKSAELGLTVLQNFLDRIKD